MDFYEVLSKRVSTRSFTDERVRDEDIKILLDAAKKAPIAHGDYEACRLTVIKDKSFIEEISREHMEQSGKKADLLFNAPLFIIFSSNKDINSKYEDAGCVLENISLAATSINLGSCYIRGLINNLGSDANYIDKLGLDKGYFPVSGIVIGHTENDLLGKSHQITTNFI